VGGCTGGRGWVTIGVWCRVGKGPAVDETMCMSRRPQFPLFGRGEQGQGGGNGYPLSRWGSGGN